MTTKGKTWRWSQEAKERHSKAKKLSADREHLLRIGTKHGLSQTQEYNSWKKMMYRCYKEADPDYKNYGARGIKVCEEWHDVRGFYDDMLGKWGECPKGFSLERVDVDGDYHINNCCWIPMSMQAKNRRPWKHTEQGLENIREARRAEARARADKSNS
ncbi:MAG: hypothetical protein DRI65_09915 [Chloroflexota bacterium]|nr:MAG: hypothetical protein DRI65_09915 [Chloroflexota bacterium]